MLYTFRRKAAKSFDRLAHRVEPRQLRAALKRIGLKPGVTVCAHSALSRLGYVVGGPDLIIDTLMEMIGPEGCLLMPSYPTGGSTAAFLASGEAFDVRNSPSKVGVITEVFRRRSGVERSLHPTNPLAGWGAGAPDLLRDHEKSRTPYGPATPYGRLADRDDAYILMLDTHIHSYLHHLQERVDFPNLHLPEQETATYIDHSGEKRTMRTKVLRPRVPYYVAIPAVQGHEPDWAILHDFTLLFPQGQARLVRRLGYRFEGYPKILERRATLERGGVLRTARLGKGEVGLLQVKGFTEHIETEFRELIARFRSFYDPERIAALGLPYT